MKNLETYKAEDYTVLIVDDNLANVKILSAVLEKANYNIISVDSGERCIEILQDKEVDIILMDVMLPGLSGFEVTELLYKQGFNNIPILYISSLNDVESTVKGFEAGGVDFITKPFYKEEVLARLENHLKIKALEKERIERIRTLKSREVELSLLNKQNEDLVRMVSHDIRNPLTGIIGLLNIMKEDDMPKEELHEMIDVMLKSSTELMQLVKDVLDKEQTNSIISQLDLKHDDINLTIKKLVELNNSKALLKKISLNFETNSKRIAFKHDIHKMEIVLNNLISNALRFSTTNGRVEIETIDKEDIVCINITDTGIGIPDEMIERFIIPSSRDAEIKQSNETGSGLGLEIVLDFIQLHKGKIWVESKDYVGTTFFIELPKNLS